LFHYFLKKRCVAEPEASENNGEYRAYHQISMGNPKLSATIGVSRRSLCYEHARKKTEEATIRRGRAERKLLFHFVHSWQNGLPDWPAVHVPNLPMSNLPCT